MVVLLKQLIHLNTCALAIFNYNWSVVMNKKHIVAQAQKAMFSVLKGRNR